MDAIRSTEVGQLFKSKFDKSSSIYGLFIVSNSECCFPMLVTSISFTQNLNHFKVKVIFVIMAVILKSSKLFLET